MSNQPAYDEATARRWLAWLARGMKSRGLTVFMIEDLQPGWLTRWPRFACIVVSSLCQVLVIALGTLSFFLGMRELSFGLDLTGYGLLLFSFTLAAVIALESRRLLRRSSDRPKRRGVLLRVLRASIRSVGVGLFTASMSVPGEVFGDVVVGFVFGLTTGFVFGWATDGRTADDDIQTVERLEWSWRQALLGVAKAIGIALMLSLSTSVLILWLSGERENWRGFLYGVLFISALYFLFAAAPVALLIGGLRGFKTSVSTMKVVPNQGIQESCKNSLLIGGVTLAATAILVFAAVRAVENFVLSGMGGSAATSNVLLFSGSVAVTAAVLAALLFGGHDVIRHYALRLVLRLSGVAPLDIARFLDYAANELQILQKVGAGYIFIHRFLLEHFADMSPEGSPARGGARSTATNAAS